MRKEPYDSPKLDLFTYELEGDVITTSTDPDVYEDDKFGD